MKLIKITNAILSPSSGTGGFNIDVAIRYGTSGPFTPIATNVHVDQDTNLPVPISFYVDETISTTVEVKTTYSNCPGSTPNYKTYTIY